MRGLNPLAKYRSPETIERDRARSRAWYHANKERSKGLSTRYYREHREEQNKKRLEYYHRVDKFRPRRIATMARLNKEKNSRLRARLAQLKDVPCADCGGRFPSVCMDFDHVRGEKLFLVCKPNSIGPALDEEIKKCDVVCSNCHRIRTHNRRLSKRQDARIESLG